MSRGDTVRYLTHMHDDVCLLVELVRYFAEGTARRNGDKDSERGATIQALGLCGHFVGG